MPDFTLPTSEFPATTPVELWFERQSFASVDNCFTLIGGGGIVSNAVRLATNGITGNLYFNSPTSWNRDFSVSWRMYIGGGSGADGMCIQWTSSQATGSGGGDCGRVTAAPLALTFPIFGGSRLNKYIAGAGTQVASGCDWRNDYYYWLDYSHSNGVISIYQSSTSTKPGSPGWTINYTFDGGTYYIGMAAAVGGAWDNHDLKSWRVQISTTGVESKDNPNLSASDLVLRMTGDNNSTTFTDTSNNARTVTPSGNAKISTAQTRQSTSVASFDGTNSYLTVTTSGLGSGDFTIEFWAYKTANSGYFFNSRTGGLGDDGIDIRHDFYITSANDVIMADTFLIALNTWVHVAIVRCGTVLSRYINGVVTGGVVVRSNSYSGTTFRIGGSPGGNVGYFSGYIDNFIFTSGLAKYRTGFTPAQPGSYDAYFSSVTLLLRLNGDNGSTNYGDISLLGLTVTGNGNAQISTTQAKFGGASLYLDGAGSYLSVADSAALDMSGDFTIECWIYPTDFSAVNGNNRCLLSFASTFIDAARPCILFNGSGQLLWYAGSTLLTTGTAVSLNQWSHVAFVRSGTALRSFINGVFQGAATYSSTVSPDKVLIGRSTNTTGDYAGYIDDVRITKVARYSIQGFLLSTQSNPAHNLSGLLEPTITLGSNLVDPAIYMLSEFNPSPATTYYTDNISVSLGSSIGAEIVARMPAATEAEVGGSLSIAPSSSSGGAKVPSTGQIYPLGYQ